MSVLESIGNFLFGKSPKIFDESGNVLHVHPKKKWDAWQNRMKNDPHLNWRNHSGTQLEARPASSTSPKKT
jgi:hypothetical protein